MRAISSVAIIVNEHFQVGADSKKTPRLCNAFARYADDLCPTAASTALYDGQTRHRIPADHHVRLCSTSRVAFSRTIRKLGWCRVGLRRGGFFFLGGGVERADYFALTVDACPSTLPDARQSTARSGATSGMVRSKGIRDRCASLSSGPGQAR